MAGQVVAGSFVGAALPQNGLEGKLWLGGRGPEPERAAMAPDGLLMFALGETRDLERLHEIFLNA